MTDRFQQAAAIEAFDLGEYCRRVEEHLTRVNDGHLVRVVGPAFELVRAWALGGVPLSVVYRGIEQKAERHRAGRSTRALRLEFCEADVRAVFEEWRRAVGIARDSAVPDSEESPAISERRKPSLSRHLDRAIDKLTRAAGRLDLPDAFRADISRIIDSLARVRDESRHARGDARRDVIERLREIEHAIAAAGRVGGAGEVSAAEAEAGIELAPYRDRMDDDAWRRSFAASVDRILRDRLGLPYLDVDTFVA